MTDKTNAFRGLLNNLQNGLNKINKDAKEKAGGKHVGFEPEVSEVEESIRPYQGTGTESPEEHHPENATPPKERISAMDDDIDEGLIIEAEPLPKKKSGMRSMSMKQKGLLCLVLVGAVFAAQTMLKPTITPFIDDLSGADSSLDEPSFGSGQESAAASDSGGDQPWLPGATDTAPGQSTDRALMFDPAEIAKAGHIDLNDGTAPPSADENFAQRLDPFTGEISASEPGLPFGEGQPRTEKEMSEATAESFEANNALAAAVDTNPFPAGEGNAPEFGGTVRENTDSKDGELLVQTSNPTVATITAQIAEKDSRIGLLESELEKAKQALDAAKNELANNQKAAPSPKSSVPATVRKVEPRPATSSTQPQRVAAAKATARPQLCVSAVAQAARNCSTCVPHAFIRHKGMETMVGHGDFVEGLRVSIVGDRLDLQNSEGVAVHKFWSSPNGCAG